MGAARPLLDGLAVPAGALGRAPGRGAAGLRRDRPDDRGVRAGDDDRPARADRRGLAALRSGDLGAAARARRLLDPRHRCRASSAIRRGRLAGIDWRFNGYGEAAPSHAADARLAEAICERLKVPRFAAPVVLEGGAVHVDGEGTCLVCARSVLDPKRNPGLGREALESVLADASGRDQGDLARGRPAGRPGRRPCRQPRLLRASGRGHRAHLPRRERRQPCRPAGQSRAAAGRDRCAGPHASR